MTLLEMMVVISIGAIATSIAVPAISASIKSMRHAEDVVRAQAQFMEARATAIDTARAISLQPDPAPGGGGVLIIRRHNSQTTCGAADVVDQREQPLADVVITKEGPDPCFLPSGRAAAIVTTTIDFGRGASVRVYPAGNMIWKGSATAKREGAASVLATSGSIGSADGLKAGAP